MARIRSSPSGKEFTISNPPIYDGDSTGVYASEHIYAHREGVGGGGDPQVITLPQVIDGQNPFEGGAASPAFVLVAKVTATMTHSGGSVFVATEFIAAWEVDTVYSNPAEQNLGTSDAGFVLTASVVEGNPTLTVNYTSLTTGDTFRYMLDIELALMEKDPP